jgi:hypothetical protein
MATKLRVPRSRSIVRDRPQECRKLQWFRFLACAAFIIGAQCLSVSAQGSPPTTTVHHGKISADLANALAQLSYAARLPMVGELSQPLPKISIPEGSDPLGSLLNEIVHQASGYKWELRGSVVHFYNERLHQANFNPLSRKFPKFVMPENVSELTYKLPNLEATVLEDKPAQGVIMTGFAERSLEKDALQSSVLEEITGREILFRAMQERPTFSVLVIFLSEKPTKAQALKAEWFWQSFRSDLHPVYADVPQEWPLRGVGPHK